jgi:hypothetical protein
MALSGDLTISFDYLVWNPSFERGSPVKVQLDGPKNATHAHQTLLSYKAGTPEKIIDVRGREEQYSLDSHGFRYLRHSSRLSVAELHDPQMVQKYYLAECEAVLRDLLEGVDRVHLFNWRVRSSRF